MGNFPPDFLTSGQPGPGVKMLATTSRLALRTAQRAALSRNIGFSAVASAAKATDPIQQMFADKVNEYAKKKAAAGGKLVDATKEAEDALSMELEKVAKAYGGGVGVDMTKFPELKFEDPAIDDVSLKQ